MLRACREARGEVGKAPPPSRKRDVAGAVVADAGPRCVQDRQERAEARRAIRLFSVFAGASPGRGLSVRPQRRALKCFSALSISAKPYWRT